jgi:energy-coupling factor transporter ATP-binding protein EcfA2
MRITKINIPKSSIQNGLEAVKMEKLGQVVLLAGRNGSGKTRLLNLISSTIQSKPKASELLAAPKQKEIFLSAIKGLQLYVDNYLKIIENTKEPNVIKANEQQMQFQMHQIEEHKQAITNLENQLAWKLIETDKPYENHSIVPFVPKNLDIKDCNNFRKNEIDNYSKQVDKVGVDALSHGTFARIQTTQERWFNATHQDSNIPIVEKQKAIEDYFKLKDLIRIFLDTDLERNINGDPTLFGFPLGQSNLSDGQKILIQLCVAIHCQQKSLDDIILFLDEPENHLHPSVIIETIERIQSKNPNGQIWIATHSIPLLSYFDPSSLWFIDNNRISYAGTIPEVVLSSLLGDENRISKLQDFINLPGIFALNMHAFECLFNPVSILTDKDDLQTLQIREEIKKHLSDGTTIRILDYGAGKGRFLANVIETNPEPISKLKIWFDYVAFDKNNIDSNDCKDIIKKAYPDFEKRYFNEYSEIFSVYDKESFDIVLMSNVLHEIEPNKWLNLFSNDGEIPKLLSHKGILILVEDQEMPIGEKAYQKGFIVLDTPELKELFSIKEVDLDFSYSDAKGDGRLKAHKIPKEYLTRITPESRIICLKQLHATSKEKILHIRKKDITYRNGKKHGFWIQQYANTGLVLPEFING